MPEWTRDASECSASWLRFSPVCTCRRQMTFFPVRGKGSDRGRAAQVRLIRYAYDFIITGHSEELLRMCGIRSKVNAIPV
jgi:hypothetical protein